MVFGWLVAILGTLRHFEIPSFRFVLLISNLIRNFEISILCFPFGFPFFNIFLISATQNANRILKTWFVASNFQFCLTPVELKLKQQFWNFWPPLYHRWNNTFGHSEMLTPPGMRSTFLEFSLFLTPGSNTNTNYLKFWPALPRSYQTFCKFWNFDHPHRNNNNCERFEATFQKFQQCWKQWPWGEAKYWNFQ